MRPILDKTTRMNKTEAKYGRHLEELKSKGYLIIGSSHSLCV